MKINLKQQLERIREANGTSMRPTERMWYRIEGDQFNGDLLLVRDDVKPGKEVNIEP